MINKASRQNFGTPILAVFLVTSVHNAPPLG